MSLPIWAHPIQSVVAAPRCVVLWDGVGHETIAGKSSTETSARISVGEWAEIVTTWLSKYSLRVRDFQQQRQQLVWLCQPTHYLRLVTKENPSGGNSRINTTVGNAMLRALGLLHLSVTALKQAERQLHEIMRGEESSAVAATYSLFHDVLVAPRLQRNSKIWAHGELLGPPMPTATSQFLRNAIASGLLFQDSPRVWPKVVYDSHNADIFIITSNNED
jgi:hypothetical protein